MTKEDCKGIIQLLKHGFSLKQSIILMENKKNKKTLSRMIEKMTEGSDSLAVWATYCPRGYVDDYLSFSSFLPLKESMELSIQIEENENQQRQEIMKEIAYPLSMFCATLVGLYFFLYACFPLLIQLMNDFKVTTISLLDVRSILLIVLQVIFFVMLSSLLVSLILLRKQNQVGAYKWLSKIIKSDFLKQRASNQFARYFYQCIRVGCKTKETLTILQQLKNKPLVSFIAMEIEKSLLNGKTMKKAIQSKYIDEGLHRFMTIAIYSSMMDEMLSGYIEVSKQKMRKRIKLITKVMKLLSYGVIALVLIFVYQILLLPLSVMSQL